MLFIGPVRLKCCSVELYGLKCTIFEMCGLKCCSLDLYGLKCTIFEMCGLKCCTLDLYGLKCLLENVMLIWFIVLLLFKIVLV